MKMQVSVIIFKTRWRREQGLYEEADSGRYRNVPLHYGYFNDLYHVD